MEAAKEKPVVGKQLFFPYFPDTSFQKHYRIETTLWV